MSQFDFPCIHFSGSAFINPATANNNILLPLVTFDPIQVKAIMPPRLYLSGEPLRLFRLGVLPLPKGEELMYDSSQEPYIEIKPVDCRDHFITWAKTPLGTCALDTPYHQLYQVVRAKRSKQPLTGSLPANWNYFGGMECVFENVMVVSVGILDDKREKVLYTKESTSIPPQITEWLGAELDMATEQGESAAVMVDVLPSLAFYSQLFCDVIRLRKGTKTLLKGTPRKGSLRFLNQHRIVNQEGPQAASGTFFSVIPAQELEGKENALLLDFFRQHSQKEKPLLGVFIRFNLFEVQENQEPDYESLGSTPNPAQATVLGTLSPWYEGDMSTITMGRLLLAEAPFLDQKKLGPVVCSVQPDREVITLDFSGSIPEHLVQQGPLPIYETFPLGSLHLKLLEKDNQQTSIGLIEISNESFGREALFRTGGLIEISYKGSTELTYERLQKGILRLYAKATGTWVEEDLLLMQECEYMVASDQPGLYADQGDDPAAGYLSQGSQKEACRIRVFHKGQPADTPLPMTIMELKISDSAAVASVSEFLATSTFRDGQVVPLPTTQAANALYVFYPGKRAVSKPDLVADLMRTGFFVSLRVLPRHDYDKYLNPTHPDYPTRVTFDVLYREFLQVYDLVYPISSTITPFTEAYFKKGWKFLRHRLSPDLWGTSAYMPSSRDMSRDQWALFCKWIEDMEE